MSLDLISGVLLGSTLANLRSSGRTSSADFVSNRSRDVSNTTIVNETTTHVNVPNTNTKFLSITDSIGVVVDSLDLGRVSRVSAVRVASKDTPGLSTWAQSYLRSQGIYQPRHTYRRSFSTNSSSSVGLTEDVEIAVKDKEYYSAVSSVVESILNTPEVPYLVTLSLIDDSEVLWLVDSESAKSITQSVSTYSASALDNEEY